ncbi:hypothetical protein K456DRAFT_1599413 [Colletotrichum gloeosporioides 23]|nr:hypothetical protein K456DRAFT_1599413 [Colletotrichum gloeosporioides 23]
MRATINTCSAINQLDAFCFIPPARLACPEPESWRSGIGIELSFFSVLLLTSSLDRFTFTFSLPPPPSAWPAICCFCFFLQCLFRYRIRSTSIVLSCPGPPGRQPQYQPTNQRITCWLSPGSPVTYMDTPSSLTTPLATLHRTAALQAQEEKAQPGPITLQQDRSDDCI